MCPIRGNLLTSQRHGRFHNDLYHRSGGRAGHVRAILVHFPLSVRTRPQTSHPGLLAQGTDSVYDCLQ